MTILFVSAIPQTLIAGDDIEISANADFVSRYLWRGLMINEAPNVQPSITLGCAGFEAGIWGSSTLSNAYESEEYNVFNHEIDFWAGCGFEFDSGVSMGLVVTDYYFPNAGIDFSNFNNYDNENGAGAHIIEAGLSIAGPEKLPISLSAYTNIFNDEGKNSYFQIDYSTQVKNVGIDLALGATTGSSENPDYYGTETFNIINIGATVSKDIHITNDFVLPIFVNYTLNPLNDISYLVFGFSI